MSAEQSKEGGGLQANIDLTNSYSQALDTRDWTPSTITHGQDRY
jgi:hypothetical protein